MKKIISSVQQNMGLILFIGWLFFALVDMWFDVVGFAFFIKLSISILVFFLIFYLYQILLKKS